MFTRLRPGKPSPALVISCFALFVALSGSSYAVIVLPKNSVGTKQLRNNAVKSGKIADNQVTGADVNEATLSQVPSAASAGSANTANTANTAANADALDGIDSAGFLQDGAIAGGRLSGSYPNPTIPSNSITGSDINEATLGTVPSATNAANATNAGNANTLDGLDSSAFQTRVTGACEVGTVIRAIREDGTVVCDRDRSPIVWMTTNLLDFRNNTFVSVAGTWVAIPGRTIEVQKQYADSALRITYQDTLGVMGQYYDGCEWRIRVDGVVVSQFSDADLDSTSASWRMSNAAHVAWATGLPTGPHTVDVQNRGNRGAWASGTLECLMGWNTTGNLLSVEEVPLVQVN
jgi:hypothetical protein